METKEKVTLSDFRDMFAIILVAFIIFLMVAGFAPKPDKNAKELPLDQNDSLYFERKADYRSRLLTYDAQTGDSLKISMIDLDKNKTIYVFDFAPSVDGKLQLKVGDFFEHIPLHSFLVVKINGIFFYKDVYVNRSLGF